MSRFICQMMKGGRTSRTDRKSTRLNSSHDQISYAVFCLKKKNREEAEALLPQISVVLRKIQEGRKSFLQTEEELDALRLQAAGSGHHLHERILKLQRQLFLHTQTLRKLAEELSSFGCELKDPDRGLIDFLFFF